MANRVQIRRGTPEDWQKLPAIYRLSVEGSAEDLYTRDQIKAWAAWADNPEEFQSKISQGILLVAESGNDLVGFGHLHPADHLSLLYILPDYGRQGIGNALCDQLENAAIEAGESQIHTEASHLSRPLFLKRGYYIKEEESLLFNGVPFTRARMAKDLTPKD